MEHEKTPEIVETISLSGDPIVDIIITPDRLVRIQMVDDTYIDGERVDDPYQFVDINPSAIPLLIEALEKARHLALHG